MDKCLRSHLRSARIARILLKEYNDDDDDDDDIHQAE